MPVESKRNHIVTTALRLFYKEGFHATGIDTIIDVAQVSKKTLYKHFKSKDELILETLRKRDEMFREKFIERTERLGDTSRARLLTVFDAIDLWINEETFSGCMFINAAAEYASMDNPCHRLCKEHKDLICDYIESLAKQAGVNDPELLAAQLNLLIEGAIVEAYVSGKNDAAKLAKKMASVFVQQALSEISMKV